MIARTFHAPVLAACAVAAVSFAPVPGHAADEPPVSPTEFFKGKVVRLEGREIELEYDFEDPGQLADWEASIPFRQIQDVTYEHDPGGWVRLKGTGSMRHRAVFKEHVKMTAEIRPFRNRDFGVAVTEQRESEVFTLYCLYDKYFGLGDGVTEYQNMIIKFIPRDPVTNANGMQDWRYCGSRGQKPEIKRGVPYKVTVEREDNESKFSIDDWQSKGKEADRDLTTQMLAFYGVKGDIRIDDVTIVGTLDPDFIEKYHLDMTPIVPPKKSAASGDGDSEQPALDPAVLTAVREQIEGYPAKTKPLAMAKLLRDPAVPVPLRSEAVERIKTVGKKQIVPYLVEGLGAKDEESRELSYAAFEALVEKSRALGYRPDGTEVARDAAMKRINKFLQANAKDFQ